MRRFALHLIRISLPLCVLLAFHATVLHDVSAADRPQWGERHSRNMVSEEVGLPQSFDPATGANIKWSTSFDTSYSSPVISGGKVFLGVNNREPRDERHQGDRGVLICLDEADGKFNWQLVVPKLEGDIYLDWPRAGICSPATVEGDRVYILSNRAEVMCLDIDGMADGNDGPFRDEGRHMTPAGDEPMEATAIDADILWICDLRTEVDIWPHDSAHSSILIHGDHLYLNTGNGVDNTHRKIRRPEAPSLVAIDKRTGRVLGQDGERIGPRIFHCTWSSPALGIVGGSPLIFFGGGDGVCYAFRALAENTTSASTSPTTFERVWRFDCDPTAPKENVSRYLRNRRKGPSNFKSMPVFHNDRIYATVGGDIWWGKEEASLRCLDATKSGDITETGQLWSYPLNRHCCSTPAIAGGLVFVADCGGVVHCVDAESGTPYWTHELRGEIWGSTLVADGKVYIGSRRGDFVVLAAEKEKKLLATVDLDEEVCGAPVAANGVLYVNTLKTLYAIQSP